MSYGDVSSYAIMKRDPADLLPLSPAMFHVLVALADGETHGYAIMKEVEHLTSGAVRLSTGTLYGIIKRLLSDGLIRETGVHPTKGDERRRCYALTPFGRDVARAEAARLEQTIAIARRKTLFRRT
jgi:DNA-binding PadR family transcriptional regulator